MELLARYVVSGLTVQVPLEATPGVAEAGSEDAKIGTLVIVGIPTFEGVFSRQAVRHRASVAIISIRLLIGLILLIPLEL